jgi:hypothetical protein
MQFLSIVTSHKMIVQWHTQDATMDPIYSVSDFPNFTSHHVCWGGASRWEREFSATVSLACLDAHHQSRQNSSITTRPSYFSFINITTLSYPLPSPQPLTTTKVFYIPTLLLFQEFYINGITNSVITWNRLFHSV